MTDSSPSSIKQFFQSEHSALQRIFSKVQQLKQLNDVLMQCLDPKLKRYCVVANIYADKLVIMTENAAVATQLRFYIPELLPKLKPKHPLLREIKSIECRIGTRG